MSTVEAGGLQGDKMSAIQKRHMVESDTSERKRHSRLSRIVSIAIPLPVSSTLLAISPAVDGVGGRFFHPSHHALALSAVSYLLKQ